MDIYIDVVFFMNIIMNSVILFLTACAAGLDYKWWRLLATAGFGSIYVLCGVLPQLWIIYTAPFKLLMSLIMIILAFGMKPVRILLLLVGIFFAVSFILGGAIFGWLFFWQTSHHFGGNIDLIPDSISWKQLAGGSCLGIILVTFITRRVLARMYKCKTVHQIKIDYAGHSVELRAKLDTGNSLYTVIGRKPVVLVEHMAIETVLNESAMVFLRENTPEIWLANLDKCDDKEWLARIQIIPYNSVGSRSMLLGFRPDRLTVTVGDEIITTSDIVIGIYSGTLSGDGYYSALLHPAIMSGMNITTKSKVTEKEGAGICA